MKAAEVFTISKKKFDKLSKTKQRLAVVQDVLDRIKLGQFKAKAEHFVTNLETNDELYKEVQVSELLKSTSTKCEVCAKGGLFMSYIGIVNSYEIESWRTSVGSPDNDKREMKLLSKIISPKQLSLIETAFEGILYRSWNEALSNEEYTKCRNFNSKYVTAEERLKAICQNMLKHDGIFKP